MRGLHGSKVQVKGEEIGIIDPVHQPLRSPSRDLSRPLQVPSQSCLPTPLPPAHPPRVPCRPLRARRFRRAAQYPFLPCLRGRRDGPRSFGDGTRCRLLRSRDGRRDDGRVAQRLRTGTGSVRTRSSRGGTHLKSDFLQGSGQRLLPTSSRSLHL